MRREEDESSVSLWMKTAPVPACPPLAKDYAADVCVVGAGIAGLSTAYELASRGLSVAVLDDGPLGGGQTQRTSAHLSNAIDDGYARIEQLHGREAARLAGESHTRAIDRIEEIAGLEQIDCDFERLDGFLCLGEGQPQRILDDELAAARRAGIAVEALTRSPLSALGPCLRFPRQAQFHPLRYLVGLAEAARRRGARIFSEARVVGIDEGSPMVVRTRTGERVRARQVVVATNTPIHERVAIHTKQAAYRTYVIGLVAGSELPAALYWDTLDPYHYVRVASDPAGSPLVLVGGEDHRVGPLRRAEAETRYEALEEWARKHVPGVGAVVERWSGEVMEPVDSLAFIGKSPGDSRIYMASGDSGMGLTHGAAAGLLLCGMIVEGGHPWQRLYDPSRTSLRAAGTWLAENLATLGGYAEWLRPLRARIEDIPHDGGAVVRDGMRAVAVHRDKSGELHVRSAVCPHLGGLVGWNDAEKTWDCPCHGSRFDRFGRLVHGPANDDLATE